LYTPDYAKNAKREFDIIKKLFYHPSIISVEKYFENNNVSFMVMERLKGMTISEFLSLTPN
jgi:serine/threonine protein kinase